jgi:peptidoglycan/xylan/chitin deacetylase (PgdA/CDA1 family)
MKKILRKLYSLLFPLFVFKNKLLKRCGGIRILIYHDINIVDIPAFERQIQWLRSRYSFLTPDEFKEIIKNKPIIDRTKILITFDDGFHSSYLIAREVLKKFDVKAIFFIISDFAKINNNKLAHKFIADHIIPGKSIKEISDHSFNLNYDQLKLLISDGHTIGSHTKTHARLSNIKELEILNEEIIYSSNALEKDLDIHISDFAYTFGDIGSFSKLALTIARKRFEYIYTGLRGNNVEYCNPLCIQREAISPNDSNWTVGTFIEGGVDIFYKLKLNKYKKWMFSEK